MAYFAEIDNNNTVTRVLAVNDGYENQGQHFLAVTLGLGGRWIQTSYNTHGGVHVNGGTPLRKNYAGVGFTFDEQRDAFIPPQPFPSWTLDEGSCLWQPPVPYPSDGSEYVWDEDSVAWVVVE